MKLLEEADMPVMPMHDLESILTDPHLAATDFFPVVDHPIEGAIRSMRVSATLVGALQRADAAGAEIGRAKRGDAARGRVFGR